MQKKSDRTKYTAINKKWPSVFSDLILEKCWGCRHVSSPEWRWLCINLKSYGVNFLPPLPSVKSTLRQLFASLSAGSSVSLDRRLMDLQPMEASCPPTVDMLSHARLCALEMTPTGSNLPVQVDMESYNTARCVCLNRVRGHPSTNGQALPSSL